MELFSAGIALFGGAGEVEVEIIYHYENAHHVADVEVRDNCKGKTDDVQLEFAVFDEIFDSQQNEGKEDKIIYPHCVMLHNNGKAAESIHCREDNRCDSVSLSCGLDIDTEGETAGACLEDEHEKEGLCDAFLGEEGNEEGEGAREIIGKNSDELTAKSSREGVEKASVATKDVSQTLEEINVLTVKIENENACLTDGVHLKADVHKKSEEGGNCKADKKIFFV